MYYKIIFKETINIYYFYSYNSVKGTLKKILVSNLPLNKFKALKIEFKTFCFVNMPDI